jgi:hypothetical protein
MTEEGTLSILRHEDTYTVHYASNNPHSQDRQPYQCSDMDHLGALLQHFALDAWSIRQALAEVWKGGFAVLPIVLSAEHMQTYFLVLSREVVVH